jgi:hypothetical protein
MITVDRRHFEPLTIFGLPTGDHLSGKARFGVETFCCDSRTRTPAA